MSIVTDMPFGRNLFDKGTVAEILDKSAFDEKFEVDIKNDTIRNIYHIENKYYVPVLRGGFSEMQNYANKAMIHPDDTEFCDIMDPASIVKRLSDPENSGILRAECRQKLVDGSYRWVQYIVIHGAENGVPDGLLWYYVFDIQAQKDREAGRSSSMPHVTARDALTGLSGREEFAERVLELRAGSTCDWACVAIDIQHFKIFINWFGIEKGNYLLIRIGDLLRELEVRLPAVCGYFGRDNFGVFMKDDPAEIALLYKSIKDIVYTYSCTAGFLPVLGVCRTADSDDSPITMYENARLAAEEAKESYTERIRRFDPGVIERKKEEYALMTRFQSALENGEITFFLQPQCRISTKKIVGAEALVRWITAGGEMIPTGRFVPFLEKNGFIMDLDKHVWELVMRWLRSTLDKGLRPVPVSVNVSQMDILYMDVPSYLRALTERYSVPADLVKVEITESAYAENTEKISAAVSALKQSGFSVLMDDFGAGYSSLNMLSSINTDVIKLDMAFMRNESSLSQKGISIVESVISMTKTLNIPVIIEGVETEGQLGFLKNMGCRYAQGYYFHRPMPVSDFEKLIADTNNLDFGGFACRTTELFRSREFLDENLFTDTVLNNILGPVAFYTQDEHGLLNITRFNSQFYDCIGDVKMESRSKAIQNYIVPEDLPLLEKMLLDAENDPVNGGECTIRFKKSAGGVFWYNMHLFYLRKNNQVKVFYGKIADATGMYQQGRSYFELLKSRSDYCVRLDLGNDTINEIDPRKPFEASPSRSMDLKKSVALSAAGHIDTMEERARFTDFFDPERLRRTLQMGVYAETLRLRFRIGGVMSDTRFHAYYIKFLPDQNDSVYVFANKELG